MNIPGDLVARLCIRDVAPEEFRILISSFFPEASHDGGDTVAYLIDRETALTVTYDKGGAVSDIKAGPSFTDAHLERLDKEIRAGLLTDAGDAVVREVCFSAIPVTTTWRHRDDFQIAPLSANAPRPPALVGLHPFALEVKHLNSRSHAIAGERSRQRLRETNLLLAAFLPWVSDRSAVQGTQDWVSLMGSGDNPFGPSGWGQIGYRGGSLEGLARDFCDPAAPPGPRDT
jgi:hypothetical protein